MKSSKRGGCDYLTYGFLCFPNFSHSIFNFLKQRRAWKPLNFLKVEHFFYFSLYWTHLIPPFQVERSLLVTGFGYEHDDAWATNIELFKEFTDISRVSIGVQWLSLSLINFSISISFYVLCSFIYKVLILNSFLFCFRCLGCEKTWCCCSRHVPCGSRNCWSILGISSEAMGYGCWCFGNYFCLCLTLPFLSTNGFILVPLAF